MRKLVLIFVLFSLTATVWAKPVLLLVDRSDAAASSEQLQFVRDLREGVVVVADEAALPALQSPYTILDSDYLPGHYKFVRRGHPSAQFERVLWSDHGRLLVRTAETVSEWSGGESPLEKPAPVIGESRRPETLDDPAVDVWLTQLAAQVNADSIFSYVSTLASYNRYARYTSNDQSAEWIRNKFLAFGYDSVYYHAFTAHSGTWSRTANNIIAILPGTASPDSIVIIGAHMDATSQSPATAAPGADDNGSGTAGLIEAARLLANSSFRHTIMFAAFNAEEQGLQGSAALATLMAQQGRRVIGLLNMDMIGYYDPAGADLWIEGFYTGNNSIWLTTVLWDNCLQFSTLVPYLYTSDGFGSDHESFHDAGYPAVLSIENEYEDYACYHNTCDLPARLTPAFMRQMALVNIVSTAELALPNGNGGISGTATLENTADYSGVRVAVLGGSQADTTDVSGAYQISGLLAGTYGLVFSKSGYISDTLTGIAVTSGSVTPGHNIFLNVAPPSSISGTISISGGTGIMNGVIVYASGLLVHPSQAGDYTLSPLSAGPIVVTAALNGYALASQTVTLAAGQTLTGVNLTLYPQWDLEASNYGLTTNGTGWAWGTDATAGSHSSSRVWGTVLGANYGNCTDYQLYLPAVSLANLDSARLNFWHWYDIEANGATQPYDGANVSLAPFGTENWTVITPDGGYPYDAGYTCNPIQNQEAYAGSGATWRLASFNLSAYLGQTLRIRLRLGTDTGTVRRGWYVDDLALNGWHHQQAVPPTRVSDLTISVSESGAALNWTPTAGATEYRIYRGTAYGQVPSEMMLLTTQAGTSYTDSSVIGLVYAFYVVVAAN